MNGLSPARHLSVEAFRDYVSRGVPIAHPIPGEPRLVVFIDPDGPSIGLRALAATDEHTQPTGLEHIETRSVHTPEGRAVEVAVTSPTLFIDAYPFLCAIADRIHLQKMTLTDAVADTARILGHLLRKEDSLTRERELGLYGELLVLDRLLSRGDPKMLLAAWRGAESEEHDFGFDDLDAEVKTTSAEPRTHWISSLTQLVPTADRPLWLVSYQLTAAGAGGMTLAQLAAMVAGRLSTPAQRATFEQRLRGAGWRDSYATTSRQRWRLRTHPAAYAVRNDFPRLTPRILDRDGLPRTDIPEVRYRIDLTGRPADVPPAVLAPAITDQAGEHT